MTAELEKIVQKHAISLQELEIKHQTMQNQIKLHSDHINKLTDSMADLRERFGSVATRDDIFAVTNKIDESVNGLLKDALSSVPHKAVAIFTGILLVIAAIEAALHLAGK